MAFKEKIVKIIGSAIYDKLEKEADNEVSLALKMPLEYEDRRDRYYNQRFLIPLMIPECELFEDRGLKVSPADITNVLFRCKLLFAVSTEQEYRQRVGAHLMDEYCFAIPWTERSKGDDSLIDEYLDKLENLQKPRTLIVEINSLNSDSARGDSTKQQDFFDQLFDKLKIPFSCYLDEAKLIEKHKIFKPDLREYNLDEAKKYFCAPSFGFTTAGSSIYCHWYASAWLRTFLGLLKIAAFTAPGQMEFAPGAVEIAPPTYPVFLGTYSKGCFCWDEVEKESWEKVPDGSLFRSFGYRGISGMWLDTRNFGGIEKFFLEHKKIFDLLKNPWNKRYLDDIAPTLDILSSAIQFPDWGAQVLLSYCCLEHIFVPENIKKENKKYIVGGINALRSDLLEWFNHLYSLRCDYAHKGFIQNDEKIHTFIRESIRNVMKLLVAKICKP